PRAIVLVVVEQHHVRLQLREEALQLGASPGLALDGAFLQVGQEHLQPRPYGSVRSHDHDPDQPYSLHARHGLTRHGIRGAGPYPPGRGPGSRPPEPAATAAPVETTSTAPPRTSRRSA